MVLLARREESFSDIVRQIQADGGKALGIPTDTSDPASVKSAFERISKEMPDSKLAAAVYNVSAGRSAKPFLEQTSQDLESSLKGNA